MINKHLRFCELCDQELADVGRLCKGCHRVIWEMAKEDRRKKEWKMFRLTMIVAIVIGLVMLAWQIQTGY